MWYFPAKSRPDNTVSIEVLLLRPGGEILRYVCECGANALLLIVYNRREHVLCETHASEFISHEIEPLKALLKEWLTGQPEEAMVYDASNEWDDWVDGFEERVSKALGEVDCSACAGKGDTPDPRGPGLGPYTICEHCKGRGKV